MELKLNKEKRHIVAKRAELHGHGAMQLSPLFFIAHFPHLNEKQFSPICFHYVIAFVLKAIILREVI